MTDDSGNFRSLLLQLSNSLTGKELDLLKFLCVDVLPLRDKLETINHGFELFQALEHLNMLSPRDRDFLASKLIVVGRIDLSNKLLGIEVHIGAHQQSQQEFDMILQTELPRKLALSILSNGPTKHSTSSTRVTQNDETFPIRRTKSEQSIRRELDAPDSAAGAVANVQVNSQQEVDMIRQVPRGKHAMGRRSRLSNSPTKHSTRSARVTQNDETFPIRRTKSEQSIKRELDAPDSAAVAMANVQVNSQQEVDMIRQVPRGKHALGRRSRLSNSPTKHSTRSARVTQNDETFPIRRTKSEQSIKRELDAPDSAAGAVANVQVNSQQEVDMIRQVPRGKHALGRRSRLSNSPTKHSTSSTRVTQNDESFPIRQLKTEQSIKGELDAPDSAAVAVANVLVNPQLEVDTIRQVPCGKHTLGRRSILSNSPTKHSTRSARVTQNDETFSIRQLKTEQSIKGELDAPDSAAVAVANVQVNPQLEVDAIWLVPRGKHALGRQSILSSSPRKHSTRSARVTQNDETFPIRQLKTEQSIQGELDAPDSAAGAVANVQVDPKLKERLQSEGQFLDPEKYDPVKRLGCGGYAKVFLVIEKDTGQRMACKMFDLSSTIDDAQKLLKSLETEVKVLSSLKHEHIVKFFGMEEKQKTTILLLEYMEGGSLMDWLKEVGPLQEPLVKKFSWQLLSAVNFLHTNGTKHVTHKDIKGANILLDKPRTNIKLADFGISTIMEQLKTATGQLTSNNEASFYWTSPELLGEEPFGRNTDIWSVGCTVIEMLTSKPPLFFENLTKNQRWFRIVHYQVSPPTNCSPEASKFLQRCLRPRSERPSAAELMKDPFVVDQQQ